jgi:endonuclease-8
MEGPPIHALADRLSPLEGQHIQEVTGNARQPIEQLSGRAIETVRPVKKRLVIETDGPAAVFHFYMYGTYRVNERREDQPPRLSLRCEEDEFSTYNCSAKVWEREKLATELDPTGDVLKPCFDQARALQALAAREDVVASVLLDQSVFGGVGNIIKNEALYNACVHPRTPACEVPERDRRRILEEAISVTEAWYERGGPYPNRGGRRIYRARECPGCGAGVERARVGEWDRITFWCPDCQRTSGHRRRPARPPVSDG